MSYRNQNIRCFCLAFIICLSAVDAVRGDAKEELKRLNNPVLTHLNKFGFSPEICLGMRNMRENYGTWRKTLKCVNLMGNTESQRMTARLCLLIMGAKQITRVPECAPGLKSIIVEWVLAFRKSGVDKSLNHQQKKLLSMIKKECGFPKHPWKVRALNRGCEANLRRCCSCFDLKSIGDGDSASARRIPKDYPGSM